MLNVRYEEENLKENISKRNTGDDLEHQKFWTQTLQVNGPTKLFIKPARLVNNVEASSKVIVLKKDVQPINPK